MKFENIFTSCPIPFTPIHHLFCRFFATNLTHVNDARSQKNKLISQNASLQIFALGFISISCFALCGWIIDYGAKANIMHAIRAEARLPERGHIFSSSQTLVPFPQVLPSASVSSCYENQQQRTAALISHISCFDLLVILRSLLLCALNMNFNHSHNQIIRTNEFSLMNLCLAFIVLPDLCWFSPPTTTKRRTRAHTQNETLNWNRVLCEKKMEK